MTGALLVDKPVGPTSHDIVAFTRRTLRVSRVGHTGTLDPLASGLLVLLLGPATRLAQFVAGDEKEYIADVRLGVATPTYDAASLSEVPGPRPDVRDRTAEARWPTAGEVAAVLDQFRGTFLQTPPPFSAKKIASVPAYEKARKHQPVDLKPVPVTVRTLEVLHPAGLPAETPDLVRLRVAASAGFYVRSLAHDIGRALGCGAHLEGLRRTRAGAFLVADAFTLDVIERGDAHILPAERLLAGMPSVTLTEAGAVRAGHGNPIRPFDLDRAFDHPGHGVRTALLGPAGGVEAVAEARLDGLLHPLVVLR